MWDRKMKVVLRLKPSLVVDEQQPERLHPVNPSSYEPTILYATAAQTVDEVEGTHARTRRPILPGIGPSLTIWANPVNFLVPPS
jgi:hypothetical protein